MPIICFFGPDGSGKTTLAKELAKNLNNRGLRVKLSWMRGTHTFTSLLAEILSNFSTFRGSDNPYYGITIPRSLKRLWQLLEFASVIPIILFKFILPSMLSSSVVAERYAPDFVAWISITTGDQRYLDRMEAKFLLALSSKAHAKIYVTATLEELSKRRKEINLNLRGQLNRYNRIASSLQAYKLDTTNKSSKESLEDVLGLLKT
jgi:GTPase SAR1 family protein